MELEDETEESLTDMVIEILATKAKVKVAESKIMAFHRIPGKSGMPKTCITKTHEQEYKTHEEAADEMSWVQAG